MRIQRIFEVVLQKDMGGRAQHGPPCLSAGDFLIIVLEQPHLLMTGRNV